jgi:F-type H+-transporting ATPase subunit delta
MKINATLKARLKKNLIEQIKHPGERDVVVTSAYPLTKEEMSQLKKIEYLKDARLENKVDESLIGGLVITDGSRIMDISLKGKMNTIIDSLLQS